MEIHSYRPLLAVLVSAFAALFILFSDRHKNLREMWTFIAAGVKFFLLLSLFPWVADGNTVTFEFFEVLPNVTASFKVDALGLYFGLLASGLWILTSLYNVGYMRSLKEHEQTRYYASFALSLSATLGIAFAGDLLTFFIFYEILTIATYPLVAHKETREAILAGRKYLVYSLSAGALFLAAIAWTYKETGTLSFTAGGFLAGWSNPRTLAILFFMFTFGFAVKAALFPVHAWLPSAMVAPTPVSALLHAVAVVKAGVFAALRITGYVFGPGLLKSSGLWQILMWGSAFTILYASFVALTQDNLKRRLAYSTISQLSYIILGAALVTPAAFFGSILHLANHAVLKITLFFCAGVIYVKTHKENISGMTGIAKKLPWTLGAFAVGTFGLSGFPLFSGFISKWFLCKGAIEAHEWVVLGVFLSSALLNLAYLFPVILNS
ncbi:MAG TPA: monovalent cation/H+ antiporter subunit D family protein, partial [bacterium]|nr:monovalent cation/H+ antiporter subunit D family protein [bacterium]